MAEIGTLDNTLTNLKAAGAAAVNLVGFKPNAAQDSDIVVFPEAYLNPTKDYGWKQFLEALDPATHPVFANEIQRFEWVCNNLLTAGDTLHTQDITLTFPAAGEHALLRNKVNIDFGNSIINVVNRNNSVNPFDRTGTNTHTKTLAAWTWDCEYEDDLITDVPKHDINNVTAGFQEVTLTNAADADYYNVGDRVEVTDSKVVVGWADGNSKFTGQTYTTHIYAKSGAILKFTNSIPVSLTLSPKIQKKPKRLDGIKITGGHFKVATKNPGEQNNLQHVIHVRGVAKAHVAIGSIDGAVAHSVNLLRSYRSKVVDTYCENGQYPESGGQGYGIRVDNGCVGTIIENAHASRARHATSEAGMTHETEHRNPIVDQNYASGIDAGHGMGANNGLVENAEINGLHNDNISNQGLAFGNESFGAADTNGKWLNCKVSNVGIAAMMTARSTNLVIDGGTYDAKQFALMMKAGSENIILRGGAKFILTGNDTGKKPIVVTPTKFDTKLYEIITVDDTNNRITLRNAPSPQLNDRVFFEQTGVGGVLATNTQYFVVDLSGSAFGLSLTSGGAPIDLTSAAGQYTWCTMSRNDQIPDGLVPCKNFIAEDITVIGGTQSGTLMDIACRGVISFKNSKFYGKSQNTDLLKVWGSVFDTFEFSGNEVFKDNSAAAPWQSVIDIQTRPKFDGANLLKYKITDNDIFGAYHGTDLDKAAIRIRVRSDQEVLQIFNNEFRDSKTANANIQLLDDNLSRVAARAGDRIEKNVGAAVQV